MSLNNRICKVCFDFINEEQIGNKNIGGMLQTLLININISNSEHPGICTTCQEKLEKCYYFKKKCMFTEDNLGPFINENVKINLNEIPIQINKCEDVEKDKNVCRLCLQYSDDDMILSKDEKEQFQAYFPEINLNLTNFVVLCSTCYDMLQKYFLFVSLCSRNQDSLYEFPGECNLKQNCGNNLEDCREVSRSPEEADEKKVVLTHEVQIKTEEEEEEQLCSSSMDCSVKQINEVKMEKIQSNSTYTDNNDDDDKTLVLLHEELDIKSDADSSETEVFYSNPGKKNSNFKMQPNKGHLERGGLSVNNLEESTCTTTNFRKFPEEDNKSEQKNTVLTVAILSSKI